MPIIADEVSGGRFGDHLSDYLHGRWVEYKTGVPLIYTPFAFSDALVFHKKCKEIKKEQLIFDRTVQCHRDKDVLQNLNGEDNVLFWIPHFTTFSIDSVVNVPLGNTYFPKCFLVDWREKPFLEIVREEISPISNSIGLFKPEAGFTSIALHFRDGGGIDRPEWFWCFPLRFPPKQFYKKSLVDLITASSSWPPICWHFYRFPSTKRDSIKRVLRFSSSNISQKGDQSCFVSRLKRRWCRGFRRFFLDGNFPICHRC